MRPAIRAVPRHAAFALAASAASLLLALLPSATAGGDDSPVTVWMKRTAVPFETCTPGERTDDLRVLRGIVGNARIVALGEGTHGTREFFQLKHRITQYLASEMGFTVFAIEANLPEAWRVNDYVLGGPGDPRELLKGMYFWTWNTEEVLDMVEWMRRFNASGRGRIEFTGFDMQTPDTAAAIVRRFLAVHDPAWADSADRARRVTGQDPGFVTSTGELPPDDFKGRHVRYSGYARTEGVTGFAGLWMRADAPQRPGVAFDNMQDQKLRGTQAWKRWAIELDIPDSTWNINFGVLMSGEGRAWFDSLAIEVDGKPWRSEAIDLDLEKPGGPVGLGRRAAHPRFAIAMDDSIAASGARSLRLSGKPAGGPGSAGLETAQRLVNHLEAGRATYGKATTPAQADWVIRNANLLLQCALGKFSATRNVRDSSMAANVEWIADEARKGAKVVVWAHNGHVARNPGWMGRWLADRYGKDMVVVGFASHEGTYTAYKDGQLRSDNPLLPGPAVSLESLAHATGLPRFLLDLRRAGENPEAEKQLRAGLMMRSIGAMAIEQQFSGTPVLEYYDVLAWVDRTEPSRCFSLAGSPAKQ